MDLKEAEQLAEEHLEPIKLYLRIFNTSDDDDLMRMLKGSFLRIQQLIHSPDPPNDPVYLELVYNRVRYDYNEDLEFFEENFQAEILAQSLLNSVGESDE
ncbi:hypothetical protein [Atopobacter phocae]|uniref:hypothetical protein n=1 Tax=Atopobacter phocae TaxID=136492 RepID=UPI00046ED488|nr:hypothetical protein [Atopobacter phocae]